MHSGCVKVLYVQCFQRWALILTECPQWRNSEQTSVEKQKPWSGSGAAHTGLGLGSHTSHSRIYVLAHSPVRFPSTREDMQWKLLVLLFEVFLVGVQGFTLDLKNMSVWWHECCIQHIHFLYNIIQWDISECIMTSTEIMYNLETLMEKYKF